MKEKTEILLNRINAKHIWDKMPVFCFTSDIDWASDSFSDNVSIVNLTMKLGFKQEGLLVGHYFHKGKFRDAIQFGLLRKDFNRKK